MYIYDKILYKNITKILPVNGLCRPKHVAEVSMTKTPLLTFAINWNTCSI